MKLPVIKHSSIQCRADELDAKTYCFGGTYKVVARTKDEALEVIKTRRLIPAMDQLQEEGEQLCF
jgi:hypothetical protein